MPQIVKGGKHIFGWSRVGERGRIIVLPETREKFGLKESEKLILIPGSRTSGGFGLATAESIKKSPLGRGMEECPGIGAHQVPEGEVVECAGKPLCWVELRDGCFILPPDTLEHYGITIGDKLLVIRGSGLAVGFAVSGPIVREAERHTELDIFDPKP